MKNKGFIAIGAMVALFTLILSVVSLMLITATSYKKNNDYVTEQINKRLNNLDTEYSDAFPNVVIYTK